MRLHYLQHVPFEDLDNIALWAAARGCQTTCTRLDRDEAFPAQGDFDGLVVMGGPMNIYEYQPYPWLIREKEFLRATIARGVPLLGVCLGAQLAADVLGGPVSRNPRKEIGWFPVRLSKDAAASPLFGDFPREFLPFHWHGDTFAIPPGAVPIASSEACANQAFQYGKNVVGLQFHLDYSVEGIRRMIHHCGDELVPQPTIQTDAATLACPQRVDESQRLLNQLLEALFA